jgi:hypothetical protein
VHATPVRRTSGAHLGAVAICLLALVLAGEPRVLVPRD